MANDIQYKLNCRNQVKKTRQQPFTDNGKLKTGPSCLHNFNAEERHSTKSQVGLNVLHLVEDLNRVIAKYKATFPSGALWEANPMITTMKQRHVAFLS